MTDKRRRFAYSHSFRFPSHAAILQEPRGLPATRMHRGMSRIAEVITEDSAEELPLVQINGLGFGLAAKAMAI